MICYNHVAVPEYLNSAKWRGHKYSGYQPKENHVQTLNKWHLEIGKMAVEACIVHRTLQQIVRLRNLHSVHRISSFPPLRCSPTCEPTCDQRSSALGSTSVNILLHSRCRHVNNRRVDDSAALQRKHEMIVSLSV
jgi:hypothetical protein